jgi:hypothetical protein
MKTIFAGRRRAFMATATASCASTTSSRRNHLWRLHIEGSTCEAGLSILAAHLWAGTLE